MTPNEWGRLQGFIGYGFVEDGVDKFAFPENMPEGQKYKQFGNSVSIPVIETMADFLYDRIMHMNEEYEIVLYNYFLRKGDLTKSDIRRCLDIEGKDANVIVSKMLRNKKLIPVNEGRNRKYRFARKKGKS